MTRGAYDGRQPLRPPRSVSPPAGAATIASSSRVVADGISDDALDPTRRAAVEDRFEFLHLLLGKVVGETFGYALTAAFTVLVVIALSRTVQSVWLVWTGYASAAPIATGIVIPVLDAAA